MTHSSAQMEVAALDRSVDSTSVQTGRREMLEGKHTWEWELENVLVREVGGEQL